MVGHGIHLPHIQQWWYVLACAFHSQILVFYCSLFLRLLPGIMSWRFIIIKWMTKQMWQFTTLRSSEKLLFENTPPKICVFITQSISQFPFDRCFHVSSKKSYLTSYHSVNDFWVIDLCDDVIETHGYLKFQFN